MTTSSTTVIAIKNLPLAWLEADPANPNHMTPEQKEALVRAIKTHGFLQPCLVRRLDPERFMIIDGHHRAEAAQAAGLSEVPCVIVDTDAQAAAVLQIGMNKLRGELNLGEVAKVIADLDAQGWSVPDLTLTGFSEDEITTLLKAAQPATEEEVLEGASMGEDREEPEATDPGGPFELVIPFATKDELQRAKRGLRRAAGKGRELGEGLLSLLESQD